MKKKKDEPKPKVAKPKGESNRHVWWFAGMSRLLMYTDRTCRCRAAMRRHTAEWTAVRPLTHMQEPLYGSETSSSGTITTLRHASGGVPEEEPSKTAESVSRNLR